MSILLEELSKRNDDSISRKLFDLSEEVTKEAENHLKLIINQLPEFDIHDESHSLKIINNIELLMGEESIRKSSSYELFLLYMSAFLHDCGMALPEWELKLLKMSEGKEGYTSNAIENTLAHDGKKPYKLSEALKIIEDNKQDLYNDFESTKDFTFSFTNENEFQRDLAARLIEYQGFRNGYSQEFKYFEKSKDLHSYLEFSDLLRYDFIRITHAQRVETYIKNLSSRFTVALGGAWGEALAKDLGEVCRSHGESMDYVKKLQIQSNYLGSETANLQFVAVLLRLGDILHFSHDRAPRSLFVEKMIVSKESLKHWGAKFQGINYTLNEKDENGRNKIKYMAYCDEPKLYYFIQDYLDWIDIEISNYFNFFNDIKYFSQLSEETTEKYHLNISDKVDRSQIRYNESKFTPVNDMKFTLNQSKILELLMGVGLYKDKFLCLRELYQNALDASRCMTSIMKEQKVEVRGNIEFGIKETTEDNITKKYIYCKDNGIGMTKEIVKKYFLNIGNSFYKSRDFQKLKTSWTSDFQPTSQFGIGILSCFMIGDKIEVTTKPLNEASDNNVSFSIDGLHEHFYYKKSDELDLEDIGPHGTLVKIYLNEDVEINDIKTEEDLEILIKASNKNSYEREYPQVIKSWNTSIYKYIYEFIGIPDKRVDIQVRFNTGEKVVLKPWNTLFNFSNRELEKIKLIYSDFSYMSDGYNPIEDYLEVKDDIDKNILTVSSKDIEYSFLLSLPLPKLEVMDWRILNFEEPLYKNSAILIDGVTTDGNTLGRFEIDYRRDLVTNGIINFVGLERPSISVDRKSITSMSTSLTEQFEELTKLTAERIIQSVKSHLEKYSSLLNSKQKMVIWDYVFNKFNSFTEFLIDAAIKVSVDFPLIELNTFLEEELNLPEFVNKKEIILKELDIRYLNKTESMIMIGKILDSKNIKVSSNEVSVTSESLNVLKHEREFINDDIIPAVVRADEWLGDLQEYDLVSKIWPIVPERLYKHLQNFEIHDIFANRSKTCSTSSNSLAGLSSTDPVLVHSRLGLFSNREDAYWKKSNWVGRFEKPKAKFWLFELNNHGQSIRERKEDFFLFSFISPRKLSEEELLKLEDYKDDKEYYSGVREGWSLLILGNTGEIVIKSGITSKKELVKLIKPSFWKQHDISIYKFIDGSMVSDLL